MFGFVMADPRELTREELIRYRSHYCGICRAMGKTCSQTCRLFLNYDLAFLSLLLSSLYEPEEKLEKIHCVPHPFGRRLSAESGIPTYAAGMNAALACYSCRDNWQDDRSLTGFLGDKVLSRHLGEIEEKYTRQCGAIRSCIQTLSDLERENCPSPDEPANCFGRLMAELLALREDHWAPTLREMGMALGRFIYLADAAVDFKKDRKRGSYNPFLTLTSRPEPEQWKKYLILEMSACTDAFERLPLVQDKGLLDKILYSGVWLAYGKKMGKKREEDHHDRSL